MQAIIDEILYVIMVVIVVTGSSLIFIMFLDILKELITDFINGR